MAVPPGHSAESDVSASAPTCYRHPNRETYVSCVRCGRPACPDCLRSAAVGQQCVECVREGNRTVRRASALFGGAVSSRPTVTWTLIALNVVIYLLEQISPAYARAIHEPVGVALGDWYRLLSNAFLHEPLNTGFGILHIGFNMYAL